jgi:6-phosphogluconolactonase
MKFRKFGKALLMGALSVGAVLGVTSCVQSYTVGFLFVTGTSTAGNGQGVISGFKIDHNTGVLKPINTLPVGSGGANPGRFVLADASRFLYVLNRGTDPATSGPCTATTVGCSGANISQFAVGGTGALAFQANFFSQGSNPFRIVVDGTGNFLYVLDAVAPAGTGCAAVFGPSITACGDVTAFKIDPSTGRLSLLVNAQVSTATGTALPYFPIPANPIDMVLAGSNLLTLSGTPATGDVVFPYAFSSSSGQLTISQNSSQPIGARQATAIVSSSGIIYVLDNEPIDIPAGGAFAAGHYLSQVLPFTAGTGGALQAQTGGAIPDDPNYSNPIMLIGESSKSKWVYLANQGSNNSGGTVAQSGIVGYIIDPSSKQLTPMPGSPFSFGSGPVCLLEDPSNQFIYTANFNDSTVTGRALDVNSGSLNNLKGKASTQSFKLEGPAAWCVVSGRTS